MASATTTTTDHDAIRRWVEEHDGTPGTVKGTASGGEASFATLEESKLAFRHQEHKASGEGSTFLKLVER